MEKIQDAYYVNGKPYTQLSDKEKAIIDEAAERLKAERDYILMFKNSVINIITMDTKYVLQLQSEFPQDLTGRMLFAYTQSTGNSK